MPQVNRLDPTTWPIDWAPEDEYNWRHLRFLLRDARKFATELRNRLEEAENTARVMAEYPGCDVVDWLEDLNEVLNDHSAVVGVDIEGWLDAVPLDGEKDPFETMPSDWESD